MEISTLNGSDFNGIQQAMAPRKGVKAIWGYLSPRGARFATLPALLVLHARQVPLGFLHDKVDE